MNRVVWLLLISAMLAGCAAAVSPQVIPAPPVVNAVEGVSVVNTAWYNYYDPSGPNGVKIFPDPAPVGWQFTFPQSQINPLDPTDPYGILLGSAHYRLTLYSTPLKIGDSISMTAAITAAPGTVFNFANGVNTCPGVADYRMILMRADVVNGIADVNPDSSAAWQDPTYRWFSVGINGEFSASDSGMVPLQPGTQTLAVPLDATRWIDVNGDLASSSPALSAAFQAALTHVWYLGFGFGGGCFAAHGVNVTSVLQAIFNLINFEVIHQ